MLLLSSTIFFITFASIVNGLTLEYIENNKICTGWIIVTGESINVDQSQCTSSLSYEIQQYSVGNLIRFCCSYNSVTQPPPRECGRQAITPTLTRIVGGQEAIAHSWPWLASLQYYGNHFCGGTLIDEYHVLTAAHCLQDDTMLNTALTVSLGLHSRSQIDTERVQRRQVAAVITHEGYNEYTNENDIAIIRLTSPVTITSYVNYACLPTTDPVLNENVMIAGWGTTSFEGIPSDKLLQANILIMDICKYVYSFEERKQICAGNYQYSKDSCQGDSGGPLMSEINGKWVVNGIVSYGDECAKLYRPGVYTRVSAYLSWIERSISRLSG